MTNRSPWCSQVEPASQSGLGRGFHPKCAENPTLTETMSLDSPLPPPGKSLVVAVPSHTRPPNHRSNSSSRSLARPLWRTKAPSEVRRPSANLGATPRSALWFVAQQLLSSLSHVGSGSVGLPPVQCGTCPGQPSQLRTRAQPATRKTQAPEI